eukprot:3938671-Alexandrium_andersonii.AAC.1
MLEPPFGGVYSVRDDCPILPLERGGLLGRPRSKAPGDGINCPSIVSFGRLVGGTDHGRDPGVLVGLEHGPDQLCHTLNFRNKSADCFPRHGLHRRGGGTAGHQLPNVRVKLLIGSLGETQGRPLRSKPNVGLP